MTGLNMTTDEMDALRRRAAGILDRGAGADPDWEPHRGHLVAKLRAEGGSLLPLWDRGAAAMASLGKLEQAIHELAEGSAAYLSLAGLDLAALDGLAEQAYAMRQAMGDRIATFDEVGAALRLATRVTEDASVQEDARALQADLQGVAHGLPARQTGWAAPGR